MFPVQRISLLKKILIEKKSVETSTLCSYLEVSDVTVRKYLDTLEREGFLIKVHGGAMLAPSYNDTTESISKYHIDNLKEKEQVAKLASSLVEDCDNIFIGPGTTCYEFSKMLFEHSRINVVTNNVSCIEEVTPYVDRLFFIGGDVCDDNGFMNTQGNTVLSQLDGVYVSKAFFGVDGIDIKAGITVDNLSKAEIIRKVSQSSTKTIILADSSKFDRFDMHRVCPLNEFDTYVTSKNVPEKYKQYFYDNNIKLLTSYDI